MYSLFAELCTVMQCFWKAICEAIQLNDCHNLQALGEVVILLSEDFSWLKQQVSDNKSYDTTSLPLLSYQQHVPNSFPCISITLTAPIRQHQIQQKPHTSTISHRHIHIEDHSLFSGLLHTASDNYIGSLYQVPTLN